MDLHESDTIPFVINFWLEETVAEAGRAIWRGHITHVPTGDRRYLRELDEIIDFIAPYLEGIGIDRNLTSKIKLQWRRWRRHYLPRREDR